MIGYVLYTDGGCRPNPGFGGAGIHGYCWNTSVTAKGIGHTSHAATAQGYERKADAGEFLNKLFKDKADEEVAKHFQENGYTNKVTVTEYLDAYVPLMFGATNNTAEMDAAIHAIQALGDQIIEKGAHCVVFRIDSMYVIKNITESIHAWRQNNWMTQLGEPVKNQDSWLVLDALVNRLRDKGIIVEFIHVDGHSDEPGNNNADWLATTGVFRGRKPNPEYVPVLKSSPSDGYWSPASENRHPFLSHRFSYFSTEDGAKNPGVYYTGNQGKVVDELGKKVSDGGYALVRLKSNDPFVELVEDTQIQLERDLDYLAMIDMDAIYSTSLRYLNLYGADYLRVASQKKQDLYANDGALITKMLHPPYLADRVIDNMGILGEVLHAYENKTDFVTCTDITDTFFEIIEEPVKVKKGDESQTKKSYKLKADIAVGYAVHKVDVNYRLKEGGTSTADLRMTMGIDLLDRNSLRKLEELSPKVTVVTWKTGDNVFQYATVIEAGEDIGIWASVNSNIRIVASA